MNCVSVASIYTPHLRRHLNQVVIVPVSYRTGNALDVVRDDGAAGHGVDLLNLEEMVTLSVTVEPDVPCPAKA